jgi:nitrite reductase (NO-forming)
MVGTMCAAVVGAALAPGCGGNDDEMPARRSAVVYPGRPTAPVVQLPIQGAPQVYPAGRERMKEVRLDVTQGLVDLGPEGKYAGQSFGGQIPGPTVRVRAGDRVRFTMTNRTDEPIAGLDLAGGGQAIDLGGVIIDRDDDHRTIQPGQTLELEFTAVAPGVHLYRGVLPSAEEAVAAGLFGMLIVDPSEGFAPAAREFAIVQSELYARPDPAQRHVGAAAVKVLDDEARKGKRPSHFGYGGRFATGTGLRLPALPGERLRLFVLNAGPNAIARFQVQGIPFDSVWPAEVLGAKPAPAGPATLPPGTGAIVEVTVPKKGRFRFLDQQLGSRGLVGLIDAAPGEPDAAAALVLAKPRNAAERRDRGHDLFVERCVSCHEPAPGTMRLAPDLAGVFQRHNHAWLVSWLTDPPKMQAEDPAVQELMRQWNNLPMPQVMLSAEQIEWVLEFLSAAPPAKKN